MKSYHILPTLLLFFWGNFVSSAALHAQTILTVGLSKYTKELRSIIESEGYAIQNVNYKDISESSLQDKEALTLFNLRQTWDQTQIFTALQVEAILTFVRDGGTLYLTSRKGYNNLLLPLGLDVSGVDGNQTGREWSLILEPISSFVPHPLTNQLDRILTDVSGRFKANSEWTILGYSPNQTPLLAIRKWGLGKIILGSGERIFRDPRLTSNRYETDIFMGSNYQYHVNLFAYLSNDFVPSNILSTTDLNQKEMLVFPNPSTQIVHIQGEEDIHTIDIISTNGQLLKTIVVRTKNTQIDLGAFPKGMYWLKIRTQSKIITKEILLN